jgi:hypothetical protein
VSRSDIPLHTRQGDVPPSVEITMRRSFSRASLLRESLKPVHVGRSDRKGNAVADSHAKSPTGILNRIQMSDFIHCSLAKRDPVSVEQVNLLRVEGEADHFSDAYAAWPP